VKENEKKERSFLYSPRTEKGGRAVCRAEAKKDIAWASLSLGEKRRKKSVFISFAEERREYL